MAYKSYRSYESRVELFRALSRRYRSRIETMCNCNPKGLPIAWLLAYAFTARKMMKDGELRCGVKTQPRQPQPQMAG